jgi:RNA polymerase sigma factor (sigma-70 family)
MKGENMIALATAVYNKYFTRFSDLRDDLINEGILGIIKCEPCYNEDRGNFATFVWICAKRSMIIYLKKEYRHRRMIAKDEVETVCEFVPDEKYGVNVPYDSDKELDKIRELISGYKGKRKQIAEDLLRCERPKDLVDKYGLTKQRISQIYVDIKKKSNEKYEFKDGYLIEKGDSYGEEI